jgi:hypothetical protein
MSSMFSNPLANALSVILTIATILVPQPTQVAAIIPVDRS